MASTGSPPLALYGAVVTKPDGAGRRLRIVAVACVVALAVVCGVLLAVHTTDQEAGSQSLAGAYYAVAKPPAFNFNRECPSS